MMGRKLLSGLAALAVCIVLSGRATADQLVVNGGFETGDFTGWTVSGAVPQFVNGMPHSGNFAAWLGAVGSDGFISQMLATVAGSSYHLSYWLDHTGGGTPNDFSVQLNGVTIPGSVFVNDTTNFPYRLFEFDFVATASTTLQFSAREDPAYWHLDDVSVSTNEPVVPEPTSILLAGLGALGLTAYGWRRTGKQAA